MKRMISLATLAILIASASLAMAGPPHKTGGGRNGWAMDDSILSKLNLTTQQLEKIKTLRASFLRDIEPLLSQLHEKKAGIRLLWKQIKLDPVKIKELEKQAHDLKGQLREKSLNYRLAFRETLTPEQSSKLIALIDSKTSNQPRK